MADYELRWVDAAVEQYLTLTPQARAELDALLRRLTTDPHESSYDETSDLWSAPFDAGLGLLVFVLAEPSRRLVLLRVLHLG